MMRGVSCSAHLHLWMKRREKKKLCNIEIPGKNLQTTKPRSTNEIKKPLFSAAC